MSLSVTEPIQPALDRTRAILISGASASKWIGLGFCAFLARLGGASGGMSFNFPGNEVPIRTEAGLEWVREHWNSILLIGIPVAVVLLGLWVVLLWLQSRGRFMFLNGVVQNTDAVAAPWREYRAEGHSLFKFKLILTAFSSAAFLIVGVGAGVILWPALDGDTIGPGTWTTLVLAASALTAIAAVTTLIDVFLGDFVVPAMYKRRIRVMEAWRVFRSEVLSPHLGSVALYIVFRILIAIVSAVIAFVAILMTMCVLACFLAIPFVGTVLMLPLIVFPRCYALYFLEQLGEPWVLIQRPPAVPSPNTDDLDYSS